MKAYFQFEAKQFLTNKKNIALGIFMLVASLYYVLVLGPAYEPIEAINQAQLQAQTTDRRHFVDTYEPERDPNGFLMLAKLNFEELLALDEPRLEALKEKDWATYTALSSQSYDLYNQLIGPHTEGLLRYNSKYFKYGQPASYSAMDAGQGYYMTARRYETYGKHQLALTANILEEKTAWQHLERLFSGVVPFILLLVGIFLVMDVVSQDFRHTTVLFGFPLSSSRKLLVKYAVTLSGFLTLLLVSGAIIYCGIGLQFGFGPATLPVTTYQFSDKTLLSLPLWQYLGQNLIFILLHFSIIFWVFAWLTLITKLEFSNLIVGSLYLVADRFYYGRGKGFFYDYSYLPFSYVRTGNVLSGYDNYFYHTETVLYNFKNGLISLSLTLLISLIITILWTKRRRFRSL